MAAPIRKARRKNLLPLQFEQKSVSTQTEDMDITRFLLGAKAAKSLKGSPEKKLKQAEQIIESYKVKLMIGIEKYSQLKNDLTMMTKEKKSAEKDFNKKVEKYDHKIAKLKDKIYTLKDELEDKNKELEKSKERIDQLSETCESLGVVLDDDTEVEGSDSEEEESEVDLEELMECICAHEESCRLKASDDESAEAEVIIDEKLIEENGILLSEIVAAKMEEEENIDIAETDSLEDVIEDMTEEREMLQARIEELEQRLTDKGSSEEIADWAKSSEDNLSVSTEDQYEDETSETETESQIDLENFRFDEEEDVSSAESSGFAPRSDLCSISDESLPAKDWDVSSDSEFDREQQKDFPLTLTKCDANNNVAEADEKPAEELKPAPDRPTASAEKANPLLSEVMKKNEEILTLGKSASAEQSAAAKEVDAKKYSSPELNSKEVPRAASHRKPEAVHMAAIRAAETPAKGESGTGDTVENVEAPALQ